MIDRKVSPTDYESQMGRVIAFRPLFTDITGSSTATLFLCQLLFWTDRTTEPDGWIFKTRDEWWKETRLSRTEQENARKALRDRSIIVEELRGLPAKLWYRVNRDTWDGLVAAYLAGLLGGGKPASKLAGNLPTRRRETRQLEGGKPANIPIGDYDQEITTETTPIEPAQPADRGSAVAPIRTGRRGRRQSVISGITSDHPIAAAWYTATSRRLTQGQSESLFGAADAALMYPGTLEQMVRVATRAGLNDKPFTYLLSACQRIITEAQTPAPAPSPATTPATPWHDSPAEIAATQAEYDRQIARMHADDEAYRRKAAEKAEAKAARILKGTD